MVDSIVENNTAIDGGGIYAFISATITGSIIANNLARASGGGLNFINPGTHEERNYTIENCTIINNNAVSGGGIACDERAMTLRIIGSTISGNNASKQGGGVDFATSGQVDIINSTITSNSAPKAAGVNCTPEILSIFNSIISGNHGSDLREPSYSARNIRNSIISKSGIPGADPRLGSPVTLPNGHVYYPLLPDSPAIDAGNEGWLDEAHLIGFDIAGNSRVFGKTIDIGSFEYMPTAQIQCERERIQRGCSAFLSVDVDDTIKENFRFFWDLNGDGIFGNEGEIGEKVLFKTDFYAPETNGKRFAKLVLVDEKGRQSRPQEFGVTMEKVPPSLAIFGPELVKEKRFGYWEFDAVDSSNLAIMDWTIAWGDGSRDTSIHGGPRSRVTPSHYYANSGQYTIKITVINQWNESYTVDYPISVKSDATENMLNEMEKLIVNHVAPLPEPEKTLEKNNDRNMLFDEADHFFIDNSAASEIANETYLRRENTTPSYRTEETHWNEPVKFLMRKGIFDEIF